MTVSRGCSVFGLRWSGIAYSWSSALISRSAPSTAASSALTPICSLMYCSISFSCWVLALTSPVPLVIRSAIESDGPADASAPAPPSAPAAASAPLSSARRRSASSRGASSNESEPIPALARICLRRRCSSRNSFRLRPLSPLGASDASSASSTAARFRIWPFAARFLNIRPPSRAGVVAANTTQWLEKWCAGK